MDADPLGSVGISNSSVLLLKLLYVMEVCFEL